MCPKIDVMERDCKKLEFGEELNRALVNHFAGRQNLPVSNSIFLPT
jgi:hypothetical protein